MKAKKPPGLYANIAAKRKRNRDGMLPNAKLPTQVTAVDGHAIPVIIYDTPHDMGILEEAYQELLHSANYADVVGAPRQPRWSESQSNSHRPLPPAQQRLNVAQD